MNFRNTGLKGFFTRTLDTIEGWKNHTKIISHFLETQGTALKKKKIIQQNGRIFFGTPGYHLCHYISKMGSFLTISCCALSPLFLNVSQCSNGTTQSSGAPDWVMEFESKRDQMEKTTKLMVINCNFLLYYSNNDCYERHSCFYTRGGYIVLSPSSEVTPRIGFIVVRRRTLRGPVLLVRTTYEWRLICGLLAFQYTS